MADKLNLPSINGPTLRSLRDMYGVSIEQATKAAGFGSKGTMSKIENSTKTVRSDIVDALYDYIYQNISPIGKDEFYSKCERIKKNVKIEEQLMKNETKPFRQSGDIQSLTVPEIALMQTKSFEDFKDSYMKGIEAQNLELKSELQAIKEKNFDLMRQSDKQYFELTRLIEGRKNEFDTDLEMIKADIEGLRRAKNISDDSVHRIIDRRMDEFREEIEKAVADLVSGVQEEKETGLSGFLKKVDESPFLGQILMKAFDKFGDNINNVITKLTKQPSNLADSGKSAMGFQENMPNTVGLDKEFPHGFHEDIVDPSQFPIENFENYIKNGENL